MEKTPKPYHHGDLRRALIDTALEMLAEDGGWQFTLRELARRAGVSHTAAYKHFTDKADLLSELARIGFERLDAALVAARPVPPIDPRGEYMAMSRAYVRFGLDHPNLYRLMFSADARMHASPMLKSTAVRTLDVLVGLMRAGQDAGWLRRCPTATQAHAAWAQLHGLTLLTMDGLFGPDIAGDDAIGQSITTFLEGIEA